MIKDRIEESPLFEVKSRYESTPLPYTDIVREGSGKEIKRTRFYLGSEKGIEVPVQDKI